MAGTANPIWLGIVRVGTQNADVSFTNVDGTPFDYNHWNTGQPTNAGGVEYCVEVSDTSTFIKALLDFA